MKYIKKFESFKNDKLNKEEQVKEEFVFKMLKNAIKGGIKGLLNQVAPFFKKYIQDMTQDFTDFSKGITSKSIQVENLKAKVVEVIVKLQNDTKNIINAAKTAEDVKSTFDNFLKAIEAEMANFEAQMSKFNESAINEGVKDVLIGARVLFGMVGDAIKKQRADFQKRFSAIQDLPKVKAGTIDAVNKTIEDAKKKINDAKLQELITTFAKTNNIKLQGAGVDKNKISDEVIKSYGKDYEELEDLMGMFIRYKRDEYDEKKKPEEQPDAIASGIIQTIDDDDKNNITIEILNKKNNKKYTKRPGDIAPKKGTTTEPGEAQKQVKDILGKTKENPEKMARYGNILKSMDDDENKIAQVQKALGLDKQDPAKEGGEVKAGGGGGAAPRP
jgi:hypothetical protein